MMDSALMPHDAMYLTTSIFLEHVTIICYVTYVLYIQYVSITYV